MKKGTFEINKYEIGERLKKVREEHGKTQEQVAKMLDVSRNTIANYESGTNNISLDKLNKYIKTFDVSYEYLIFGREGISDYELYQKIQKFSGEDKEIIDYLITILPMLKSVLKILCKFVR